MNANGEDLFKCCNLRMNGAGGFFVHYLFILYLIGWMASQNSFMCIRYWGNEHIIADFVYTLYITSIWIFNCY